MKNFTLQNLILSVAVITGLGIYISQKLYQAGVIKKFIDKFPDSSSQFKLPNSNILYLRYINYLIIAILLIISLLNPSFDNSGEKVKEALTGVDILFLVDVSLSMNATDTLPSRMGRFKEAMFSLLPELSGNRLGIIAFAGTPFLYCPMTSDISAFSEYLRGLGSDMIPNTGTNLGMAFEKAKEILDSSKIMRNRIVVLVSDGENMEGKLPSKFGGAEFLVWGIGTTRGGNIYYKDESSSIEGYITKNREIQKDPNLSSSDLIISKLNETFLNSLADQYGGTYVNLSEDASKVKTLPEKIRFMQKNSSNKLDDLYKKDGYQYFLFPALILFLLDISILEILLKKSLK